MKREIVDFLQKIKVNTRFVSILDKNILINNLRFSRFSRKKEEIFRRTFPDIKVVRSKLFMKISTRASHTLKKQLHPQEKIFLIKATTCQSHLLYAVLEPYTRKYGIQILEVKSYEDLTPDNSSLALPLILDEEVVHLVSNLLNGDEITLISSTSRKKSYKCIYPLVNIPDAWIMDWKKEQNLECEEPIRDGRELELINFLSSFIPDVKEKMYQSAKFLDENKLKIEK